MRHVGFVSFRRKARTSPYHQGFRVTTQGILQETRQFRVSVRDVFGAAVNQRRDHVAQGAEREIDSSGLAQSVAFSVCNTGDSSTREFLAVDIGTYASWIAVHCPLDRLD
jgi:hypothetical protein